MFPPATDVWGNVYVRSACEHTLTSFSKHRKHPGGRGMAGGQHHHRTNIDKYHPGYFGYSTPVLEFFIRHLLTPKSKVGMRYFHKMANTFWKPTINLDKLWSLVPAEKRDEYLTKKSGDKAPVLNVLDYGYAKVYSISYYTYLFAYYYRSSARVVFPKSPSSSAPAMSLLRPRRRSRRPAVSFSSSHKCPETMYTT